MSDLDLADVDLVGTNVRMPLAMECTDAILHTLDRSLPEEVRHWWHGVFTGYLAGFGLKDAHVVELALCFPYANPDYEVGDMIRVALKHKQFDQQDRNDFAQSSGVLYGYKVSTSERHDAEECSACSARILTGLDDFNRCDCGDRPFFCSRPDCWNSWDHSRECLIYMGGGE